VNGPDTLLGVSGFRVALVALGTAVLATACAAGQHAQTAEEKPSLDGTYGTVGKMQIAGVSLRSPIGPSYPAGSSVGLTAYLVNNGNTPDSLVKVSSPAFPGGWDVVSTPSLAAGPSGSAATATTTTPTSGKPQRVIPGSAVGFGLQNLSSDGAGSPESLVLIGLDKSYAPLFPGSAVKVTFTFARAGETTLTVPVRISSTPNQQTLPGGSPTAEG
jgi:copper(I)-binding protein